MRAATAVIAILATLAKVSLAGNLDAILQVVNHMQDGVVVGNLYDGPVGEDELHGVLEHLAFDAAVIIVGHEESAAQKELAKFLPLLWSDAPFANLHRVEPGLIEFLVLINVYRLFGGTYVDAREALDGLHEMAIGAGIVLCPEGKAQSVITHETTCLLIAVVPAAGKHHARKLEFGLLSSIGGRFEAGVLNAGILAEGLLERVNCAEAGQRRGGEPNHGSKRDSHGLCPEHSTAKRYTMFPAPLIRSLLPGQNSFGFSTADFIFLALAVAIVVCFLAGPSLLRTATFVCRRPWVCAVAIFVFPIGLRLLLIAQHPVPVPRVADDFSYLLLGDTLAHFRLANATHPMHRFFESVFVVQEPSYASIYPMGQGIALAIGQLVFHQPWAGVVISIGLLAALCYWMLLAWVPPGWALLGGLLAALEFGPLSPWMNTYWGGAVSAIAGCLIFGALPRLRTGRWAPILLGLGLGLQLLTRPYEFVLLLPALLLFRPPIRAMAVSAIVLLPFGGLTLLQNKEVTGKWLTLPYQLSRNEYGIPTTFTVQPVPVPNRELTIEQKVDYEDQVAVHGAGTDTASRYVHRLITRIRFYRFFFFPALYVVLLSLMTYTRRQSRSPLIRLNGQYAACAACTAILWMGDAFYPYFYPHYIAVACCLFVLLTIESLRCLSRLRFGPQLVTLALAFCVAQFAYALTPSGENDFWNALNPPNPESRALIEQAIQKVPRSHLIFVRYGIPHKPQEWVHNSADIDHSRVIWAIDRGDEENAGLKRYFPDRAAWVVEPDSSPVRLTRLPTP